ncbi:transmembrane protein 222 [Octopus bimaculoides]|uniref:transmembrane protein 222 n=1 Tax=Octopus bimaculoides TaxID=37653 RepID=UPI0022E20B16|nr:transmembrane protein 222 [Octopus bimaculoides]
MAESTKVPSEKTAINKSFTETNQTNPGEIHSPDISTMPTVKNGRRNSVRIDLRNSRFPFSIVWTPIPCLTWFFPIIGHMGIATSSGIIRDFAGPYFVSVSIKLSSFIIQAARIISKMGKIFSDVCPSLRFEFKFCRGQLYLSFWCIREFDFAALNCVSFRFFIFRYWTLDPSKVSKDTWDWAVAEASEEYKKRMHNLFCDNCHSHVAMALNLMKYDDSSCWNMVKLCFLMMIHSRYVSFCGFLKTWLPFLIVFSVILILILLSHYNMM